MTSTGISWELEPSHSRLLSLLFDRLLSFPFPNIGAEWLCVAGDLEARKLAVLYNPESHRERINRNLEFAPRNRFCHIISADQRSHGLLRHLHSALDGQRARGLGCSICTFWTILAYCRLLGRQASTSLDSVTVDDLSGSKRGQGA